MRTRLALSSLPSPPPRLDRSDLSGEAGSFPPRFLLARRKAAICRELRAQYRPLLGRAWQLRFLALLDDDSLLARQAELQREAATFVRELGLVKMLERAGRVVQLGSVVTGLMVWRDVDFGVDAPGLTEDAAWETLRPVLPRCSSLHYANDREERRHYFVMRIEGWKVDVSLWFLGMPPGVEVFQSELPARLTRESRMTILRLKEFWHRQPQYPEIVSAWEIYDAVLNHGVRALDELDAFLAARGLPTRGLSGDPT